MITFMSVFHHTAKVNDCIKVHIKGLGVIVPQVILLRSQFVHVQGTYIVLSLIMDTDVLQHSVGLYWYSVAEIVDKF